jgi:hypothetical protein
MEDPAVAKTLLMQLRVMGVRIGIDDFGTGHSSFAYLHQFPADFLKVDQSFIRGMEASRDKADIVGTMTGLAAQLGLHVIAEGIETEAGLGLVRSRQCEYLQGFLFSRPVDADAAADLLRNGVPQQIGSISDDSDRLRDPDASRRLADVPKRKRVLSRAAYLGVALAALGLIAFVGLPVRLTRGPVAPNPSSPPTAVEPRPTGAVPAEPPAPRVAPRPPQPVVVTIAVEHKHGFGSCRGNLRVSPSGLSFTADNAKDSFSFKYSQFQSTLADGTLAIKSDQKVYRFKAANVTGDDANLAQLRKALKAISGFRPK